MTGAADEPARAPASGIRRLLPWIVTAAALALAAYLLRRIFSQYGWDEIVRSAAAVPTANLALAALFAAASYLCLTVFDFLAVRCAGRRLPWPKTALASFTALSIGHTVGLAALSSGAIRYRFYSGWGLKAGEIANVVLFCAVTVGFGLATLAAASLVLAPGLGARLTGLDPGTVRAVGVACGLVPAGYLVLCATVRRTFRIRRWSIALPPARLAAAQLAIGPVNFACVAACLHQTLAASADAAYPEVLAVYVIANVTALVSHVPGGLGVIESVVLALVPAADVIGALLLFRVVYFLVPFLLGGLTFAAVELRRRSASAQPR